MQRVELQTSRASEDMPSQRPFAQGDVTTCYLLLLPRLLTDPFGWQTSFAYQPFRVADYCHTTLSKAFYASAFGRPCLEVGQALVP